MKLSEDVLNEWLDTEMAAAYLKISQKELRYRTANGEVRAYKLGRLNRYKLSELRILLESNPKYESGGCYGNKKEPKNGKMGSDLF